MKFSKCRGCGKKIIWGTTPEGRKIPLDTAAPVYFVCCQGEEIIAKRAKDSAGEILAAVSHFTTCPEVHMF